MQLAIFLVGSLVAAVFFRKRIVVLISLALALRIFVPSVAAVLFTGNSAEGQIQPATYFLLVAWIVAIANFGRAMSAELRRHKWFYLTVVSVFVSATVVTASLMPPVSTQVLFDTLGAAIILCLMVRTAIIDNESNGRRVAHIFLAIACVQAVIAIAQRVSGSTLFWIDYMSAYYWWTPTATRATGTVGAWLDLAALLAVALPLAASVQRVWLRLTVMSLLVVGIVLSQGRTALIIAAACVVMLVLMSAMGIGARLLSVAAVCGGTWVLITSDIFSDVTDRFHADDLSTAARTQAADYALAHLSQQPWYGSGFLSNGETRSFGLISSFENGYLMYFWDIGIPLSILLFLAMASPLRLTARMRVVPGSWLSLASAMLLVASYSGFQTPGPMCWTVFLSVGLAASRMNPRSTSVQLISDSRQFQPFVNTK